MIFGRHILLVLFCTGAFFASAGADTPYPPIGVPSSTGSQWGTSYQVGTQGNNLIQLDSQGRLPALDGSQLFNLGGVHMIYPPAGVANSTGSSWGASYIVGASANNLIALDSNARLPAVDGSQLTNMPPGMVYPGSGVPSSTGASWGASYAVGVNPYNLVQLDSDSFLPPVGGTYLKHLTNIIYQPFTATLQPGQIAIDTNDAGFILNVGGNGGQQELFFDSQCPAGATLIHDGAGSWFCGFPDIEFPPAGVATSTGTAWGPSYLVGTSPNNLVQLDANARLPAVDGSQLTNIPPAGSPGQLQYNENGSVAGLNVGEGLYVADGELRAYTFILFWGGIEGNLADQTDLWAALNARIPLITSPQSGKIPVMDAAGGFQAGSAGYTVGENANNLVQLDSLARLPAVDGSRLLNLPGTSYTFSSGLTNADGNVSNNLITGIAGGQTIYGGTEASETLTLRSTTNTTKGSINIPDRTVIGSGTGLKNLTVFAASSEADGLAISGTIAPGLFLYQGSNAKGTLGLATGNGNYSSISVAGDIILRNESTATSVLIGNANTAILAVNASGVGLFHKPTFLFDVQPPTIGSTSYTRPWTAATAAQIAAFTGVQEGAAVWDTTNKKLKVYDGSSWLTINE